VRFYKKQGQVAERPHLNLPPNTYEEELGLDGFFGPVAHLYHRQAPTGWSKIEKSSFQWPRVSEAPEEYLKPQCYKSLEAAETLDFYQSGRVLFWNDDMAMHLHRFSKTSPIYFRNADASEIIFIHKGLGALESPFGEIQFKPGDYLSIPKGVSYRLRLNEETYLIRIESFQDYYKKPDTGIMGQQALYHEEGIRSPQLVDTSSEGSCVVRVQKDGKLTDITYPYDLRAVAGWCGTLYPFALSVSDIAPAMSSVAHLPPSINSTFVTPQFIICTFLPRPLEEPEGALKVPFYHSNIDYDEIIFYHAGDFFSRDNMGQAYITMHPRGINHGPHPKALKNQQSMKRTNEIAVMIDTKKPLKVSSFARTLELPDYWASWKVSS